MNAFTQIQDLVMPLPSDSDSWRRSPVTVKALALPIRSRYSCSSSITVCDGQAFRVAAGGDTCIRSPDTVNAAE